MRSHDPAGAAGHSGRAASGSRGDAPAGTTLGGAAVIHGAPVDAQTRCVHYASPLDVVAIRFACCGDYYPCYRCHEAYAGHAAQVWPASAFDTRAVLCGVCRYEMTIREYLAARACPHCHAPFNPRCSLHASRYFEIGTRDDG
ncbi:MAG TPA: CHY zinc finger protein [Nevskiaceae bacterium]|nr:CHY zinc finger protein [Nevskiaceae bacterium]